MNQRRQIAVVTAVATLLSAAPLSTVFDRWTWAAESLCAVALVCAVAIGMRALRAPVWGQVVAMLAALTILLTWMFGTGALLGTVPTPTTVRHFGSLLRSAGQDIHDLGIPVPDRTGLLLLTTLSIGLVAIAADLFVVTLRRPALAGFPMLAIYWIPVLVHTDAVSVLPFMVGAVGFLWLLAADNVDRVRRFGRRFTGEGRDVDAAAPSPLAAAGRRLAVVGVALAVVLPLAVPGMTGGLLNQWGGGGGTGDGNGRGGAAGATVNLFAALSGQLNRDKSFEMVKVTTDDPAPYYLRFGVADELTDAGFSAYTPSGGDPVTTRFPAVRSIPGVRTQSYHATVEVTDFAMGLLPIYGQPTRTDGLDSSWYYDADGNLIYSNRSDSHGKKYSFDFIRTDYSPEMLRTAQPLPASDLLERTQTRVPRVPLVQELVAQLTAGKTTVYDKVRAIYDYFSSDNGFGYTESTKTGTSGTDIVDFLTGKQGYCEQYAAALAWLVRAAGIPARVAFGFTRGSAHEGQTYTLTNFNLHAWTEVYFSGFGWVPFDATPTAYIAGSVSPSWAPDVNSSNAVTPGLGGPGGPGASASAAPGGAAGQDPNAADQAGAAGVGGNHHQAATWPWWLLGSVLLVMLILLSPAMRRATLRRSRRRAAPAAGERTGPDDGGMRVVAEPGGTALRAQAHATWDELLDTLVDFGITVNPAETPRVTVTRLRRTLALADDQATALELLGRVEERARYARRPHEVDGLAVALRAVCTAIARRATRGRRLRAALLPPSVLRRWRTAVAESTSATVVELGRWRDALVRSINPRRLIPGRATR